MREGGLEVIKNRSKIDRKYIAVNFILFYLFVVLISYLFFCRPVGVFAEITSKSEGIGEDSFSGLVISEDVMNEPDEIGIEFNGFPQPKIYEVPRSEDQSWKYPDDRSYEYMRSSIYSSYVRGSGKIFLEFPQSFTQHSLDNVDITLTYPKVGYLETNNLDQKEIGAIVKIDNIKKSPVDRFNRAGFGQEIAGIDIATNLFSGMSYVGISAANWTFQFFDVKTGDIINFDNTEGSSESVMSFSSLNGHGGGKTPEFVREYGGREGKTAHETIISKDNVATPKGNYLDDFTLNFNDVYHGMSNSFTDYLGGLTYHKSSVQYALSGEENTFQIGTTYSSNTAWYSLASSRIDAPYKHRIPIKTVQPLQQFDSVSGEASGEESGFEQRYWDDLDVFSTSEGNLEVPSYYRVKGHDADKSNELATGVPKKERRFLEKDDEFYYFINQRTINLASDGIILPTGYEISDELPEGVVLADNPFTLYDLEGNSLEIENKGYEGQENFSIVLNENQVNTINKQAGQITQGQTPNVDNYGKDFSLRVRVKVTDEVDVKKLQVNQASTTFTYFDSSEFEVTQNSNRVATKLKEKKAPIEFEKVDQFNRPVGQAIFKLYEYDENASNNKGTYLASATSNNQGKVKFTEEFSPGKYVLEESEAPSEYKKHDDVILEIDDKLNVVWPKGIDKKIVNTKGYNLTLNKVDENNKPLKGAEFELYGGDLPQGIKRVSNDKGEVRFAGGPLKINQTYQLRETKAPEGYEKLEKVFQVEISEDGKEAFLIDGNDRQKLDINFNVASFNHYEITGSKELAIPNKRLDFGLEITKQDKDSKKPLKDVSFKVFKEKDGSEGAKEYQTDSNGKILINGLDRTETYHLKEVKTNDDYILLDKDIIIKYDQTSDDWKVYEEGSNKPIDNVKWDEKGQKLSILVTNEQKKMLPATGGSGRILMLMISGILGITAGVYFINDRKGEV